MNGTLICEDIEGRLCSVTTCFGHFEPFKSEDVKEQVRCNKCGHQSDRRIWVQRYRSHYSAPVHEWEKLDNLMAPPKFKWHVIPVGGGN